MLFRGRTKLVCAFVALLLNAACSPSENKETAIAEPAVEVPEPKYDQRDGDIYMYLGEDPSEGDRKQGKTTPVIMLRYLGTVGQAQRLEQVDANGNRETLIESSAPYRVSKQTDSYGNVSRVAVPIVSRSVV
jgi:hypothetical protein